MVEHQCLLNNYAVDLYFLFILYMPYSTKRWQIYWRIWQLSIDLPSKTIVQSFHIQTLSIHYNETLIRFGKVFLFKHTGSVILSQSFTPPTFLAIL